MKKIIVKAASGVLKTRGYSEMYAPRLLKALGKDIFKNRNNSLKEKIWAYKRGFLSSTIQQYKLTPDNYKLFVSDFEYMKMHPVNNRFRFWIDDKLTTKYILAPFDEYLPEYYFHVQKGEIKPFKENFVDLPSFLEKEKDIALKPVMGSKGVGFCKISYDGKNFYINYDKVSREKMERFIQGLDGYLATEYISAHEGIRKVSDYGLNTLRVMVINETGKEIVVANSFMRFSTRNTGFVDNASAGGVFAIVDVGTGKFYGGKREENGKLVDCPVHPDTGVEIEGVLPHWEHIKKMLSQICEYLFPLTYLGFDIAVTQDGFKIIEINSHQAIRRFQAYYPLLEENPAREFFRKRLKRKRGGKD